MPRKAKRPCAHPGCPNLTDGMYCEAHQHRKGYDKDYERYDRDPEHKKRYGRRWREIRARYFNAHPYCEQCFSNGKMVKAYEVHHKKPLREGGTNDMSNLISLCYECHSKIHYERGDRQVFKRKNYSYGTER